VSAETEMLQAEGSGSETRAAIGRGPRDAGIPLMVVLVGTLALAVAYLLYTNWNTSQRLSRAVADDFQGVIAMRGPEGGVHFFRDSGYGRPTLVAADDKPLLEFSDWHSTLFVDGASSTLWQFPHSYSMDVDRQRLFHSNRGPSWELQKVVSLAGPGTVTVEYFFTALGPVRRVDLLVQHIHWWYSEVRREADGFVALVPAGSREQVEQGMGTHPAYQVSVRVADGLSTRAADPIRLGVTSQYGIGSVVVSLSGSSPPFNQRVRLGSEEVSWRPAE